MFNAQCSMSYSPSQPIELENIEVLFFFLYVFLWRFFLDSKLS